MTKDALPFSFILEVRQLPPGGAEFLLEPNEDQRRALAADLDLIAVSNLTADLHVTSWRKIGVKVAGVVRAEVVQTCVVTLEPVAQTIEEPVEVRFLPDSAIERPGKEVDINPEDEGPEPFCAGVIDLGAVVTEHLALGLDPYPRKPGVVFHPPADDLPEGHDAAQSPFAALRGLPLKGTTKSDDDR